MKNKIGLMLFLAGAAGVALGQSGSAYDEAKRRERTIMGPRPAVSAGLRGVPTDSVTGTLDVSSQTWDRIVSSSVDPGCNASSTPSAFGVGVPYLRFPVIVSAGVSNFEVTIVAEGTTVVDTVLALYCDPFDPANPAMNLVAYNDDIDFDGGNLLSAFVFDDNIALGPGQYWIVVSTFAPGDFGDFQLDMLSTNGMFPVELQSFTVE